MAGHDETRLGMHSNVRIFTAEAIGTAVLVTGGCGTAVLATGAFAPASVGVLGVAFAFGLSLLVMAYAIGNISGCHINPAVTAGLWLLGKVKAVQVPYYVAGQLMGSVIGGLIIFVMANGRADEFDAGVDNFAVNGWNALSPGGFDFSAMAVAEIVMTAILVFVVASTTHHKFSAAAGGLAVGFTLTLIHLISIPIDNTSVNPARSLGVAIFAGGDAIEQLWAFFVFPLIGAAVGAMAWKAIDDGESETTVLGPTKLSDVADEIASTRT
jgi:aquaporin Z